jgi:hypothetical protein
VKRKALELALDIRKFEVSLYWQRATYFWTLIAAAFVGYLAILAAGEMKDRLFNAFAVACIGFIFSLAWFLANRGSKFWQENWELHVDMLEDGVSGRLYKTVLQRPVTDALIERLVDGPLAISVSRVNQWVSLFTLLIWLALASNALDPFSAIRYRQLEKGGPFGDHNLDQHRNDISDKVETGRSSRSEEDIAHCGHFWIAQTATGNWHSLGAVTRTQRQI